MIEVSGGLVVRNKKLLMKFNEEEDFWTVPQGTRNKGELTADTAERVIEETTGCCSEVIKYRKKLKTSFIMKGEEHVWQPYIADIEGEPEDGEWVPLTDLESKELSPALQIVGETLADKL